MPDDDNKRGLTTRADIEAYFKSLRPTACGRAWYAHHVTAAVRFRYRTMSIRDLVNVTVEIGFDGVPAEEALAAVIELERRVIEAGFPEVTFDAVARLAGLVKREEAIAEYVEKHGMTREQAEAMFDQTLRRQRRRRSKAAVPEHRWRRWRS